MGFPKNSKNVQNYGKNGTRASDNPVRYTVGQNVAGKGGVVAGRFVWSTAGTTKNDIYNPNTFLNTGEGVPTGLISAETLQTYVNGDEEATMLIPEGQGVMVAETGDFFTTVTAAATIGQAVFAKLKDGSIVTGAKSSSITSAVETAWIVSKGGDAGDTIIISKG